MKKVIEITGEPLFPIKVGENAVISEDGSNTRRTSTVMRIENISKREIRFETCNSIYHLHTQPGKSKSIAGEILLHMFRKAGY